MYEGLVVEVLLYALTTLFSMKHNLNIHYNYNRVDWNRAARQLFNYINFCYNVSYIYNHIWVCMKLQSAGNRAAN